MIKRFSEWIQLKEKLHNVSINKSPFFKEGEIWWCSIGDNIGTEINGKSKYFSRPVLIYKKFSKNLFFGLPLTSKLKTGSWFVGISFFNKDQTVVLYQGRTFNSARLMNLIGQCNEKDLEKVKAGFRQLYIVIPSHPRRSWEIPKNLYLYIIKLILSVKLKLFKK